MRTIRKRGALAGLVLEIVKGATPGDPSFEKASAHLSAVAMLDYAAGLRRHFDRAQLQGIVRDLRRSIPGLNRHVFATTDLRRLSTLAAGMGARMPATRFSGREGQQLRGFYADKGMFRRRPLICVNTANHPVAVAAAFWHEVGHHFGRRIFNQRGLHALDFTTDCHNHLDSRSEIVADMVMVLGGYPQAAARRLFGGSHADVVELDANLLVARARTHLQSISFDFTRNVSAYENLCYLAGMIHVAKLRAALFREYGI